MTMKRCSVTPSLSRHRTIVISPSPSHCRTLTFSSSLHRPRPRWRDSELHVLGFFFFYFLCPRDQWLGHIVFVLSVISSFCHSVNVRKCNLDISHEYPQWGTFPWVPTFLALWPRSWSLTLFFFKKKL